MQIKFLIELEIISLTVNQANTDHTINGCLTFDYNIKP